MDSLSGWSLKVRKWMTRGQLWRVAKEGACKVRKRTSLDEVE